MKRPTSLRAWLNDCQVSCLASVDCSIVCEIVLCDDANDLLVGHILSRLPTVLYRTLDNRMFSNLKCYMYVCMESAVADFCIHICSIVDMLFTKL